MPTHRIPRARLDEDLRKLARQGERVEHITIDPDADVAIVITEYVGTETRGAS